MHVLRAINEGSYGYAHWLSHTSIGPTTYAKYRQDRQFMNLPSVVEIIKVSEGHVETRNLVLLDRHA